MVHTSVVITSALRSPHLSLHHVIMGGEEEGGGLQREKLNHKSRRIRPGLAHARRIGADPARAQQKEPLRQTEKVI